MGENSSLRKKALEAKKRLNGASNEKKKRTTKQVSSFAVYKNLYKNDFQVVTLKNNDNILYEKVKTLLNADYDSPKILHDLVDEDVYNSLPDDDKRMEYMLKLADKYNALKTKYINECINTK